MWNCLSQTEENERGETENQMRERHTPWPCLKGELEKCSEMNNDERVSQFDSNRVEVEAQCEEIWCSLAEDSVNTPVDSDSLTQQQSRRRLTHIREKSEKTLKFLKEYGLTPKRLTLSNGNVVDITISYGISSYSKLPEAEKETLRSLVVLLDRFVVRSSAYHEITQLFPTLPRTHSVISMKNDMTSTTEVKRVPGNVPEAMLSFRHELQKKVAQKLKCDPDLKRVKVQLTGDGTQVSRITNFVVVSFPAGGQ
ncbi:uncharacterized protein LOC124280121 [Haliotis rubra]|uniref:uncharacterized protein LOC124280121 n=1 Tax=Haliotis rubra TaxID=36100 RepID=UPI001EE5F5B7|nr:uncharacterized protein LOC124280121 [Haliotis rubra]